MNYKFIVAICGLLCSSVLAEDEEAASNTGKNEARLLIGKHVSNFLNELSLMILTYVLKNIKFEL